MATLALLLDGEGAAVLRGADGTSPSAHHGGTVWLASPGHKGRRAWPDGSSVTAGGNQGQAAARAFRGGDCREAGFTSGFSRMRRRRCSGWRRRPRPLGRLAQGGRPRAGGAGAGLADRGRQVGCAPSPRDRCSAAGNVTPTVPILGARCASTSVFTGVERAGSPWRECLPRPGWDHHPAARRRPGRTASASWGLFGVFWAGVSLTQRKAAGPGGAIRAGGGSRGARNVVRPSTRHDGSGARSSPGGADWPFQAGHLDVQAGGGNVGPHPAAR